MITALRVDRFITKLFGIVFIRTRRFIPIQLKLKIVRLRAKAFNMFSIIYIETSSACNRRCSYCPNAKYDTGLIKNTKRMPLTLFHKFIDELRELCWTGQIQLHYFNEPLLDERLPDLVKYTRNKLPTVSISIFTNGDFLTIALYRKLVDSGVTDFVITQHSEERSKAVTGVLDYRSKHGDDGIRVYYVKLKLEFLSNRGGLVDFPHDNKGDNRFCLSPTASLIIRHTGDVVLCCNDYFGITSFGNVKDESLMHIWNTPLYKQLRGEVNKGIFNLEICKKCRYLL